RSFRVGAGPDHADGARADSARALHEQVRPRGDRRQSVSRNRFQRRAANRQSRRRRHGQFAAEPARAGERQRRHRNVRPDHGQARLRDERQGRDRRRRHAATNREHDALRGMIMHTARVLAFSALTLLAGGVAAEPARTPSLKGEVTVSGEFVRLGDLIEVAGANATAPVFRAPELGSSGTIQVYRVIEAARAQGVLLFDARGLSEVVVLRASRTIALPELERTVAETAARQYGFADA